ncbi:MAG TPA: isocitrate/isopropylmalate family dehydrogenase [Planctomycetota bacterium]|nr:isocitrate/isopropylmalate family dehydrogenase [Planctomycetota bacterium]
MSRLTDSLPALPMPAAGQRPVGVLAGEGVGPEVIRVSLRILSALASAGFPGVEVRHGPSDRGFDAAAAFCEETFAAGGAILSGPFAGRFVYDLRRRFDLYCKLSPLRPPPALRDATRLRPESVAGADILVVRDNAGGIYQGTWGERVTPAGRLAEHAFSYAEADVRRILAAGARLARRRRGRMAVIVKPGGIPSVSRLWCDCAADAARDAGIEATNLDVDYAAYRLIQHPQDFDVICAPNMCGDVLNDLGAVLLGSRGVSFSGNFSGAGAAVYQTNHGAAKDLAGTDRANPAAQVLSLAMLLRESLRLDEAAALLERALEDAWARGFRTADVAGPGSTVVGTAAMGDRIAESVARLAGRGDPVLVR